MGTRGRPPVSSVARVRAKRPTWYFSQTGPMSGRLMRMRSISVGARVGLDPADEEKDQQRQRGEGIDSVALRILAQRQQKRCDHWQLGAQLLV